MTIIDTTASGHDIDVSQLDFTQLMSAGIPIITLPGVGLVDKPDLIGIPHAITAITYQEPVKQKDGTYRDYVSVEATVGDETTLRRVIERGTLDGVTDIHQLKVDPNERIIYNDGSTGIRRQLTGILSAIGLVDVGHTEIPGDKRFDTASNEWVSWDDSQVREYGDKEEGTYKRLPSFTRLLDGSPLVIRVRRGLYVSEYSNEYGDGTTFYLK